MNKYTLPKQAKLFFVFMVLLASCNKDINLDKWDPQMLMPIVKASATVENVADLRDRSFVQQIPALDIGYTTGVQVNVPPTQRAFVGPYAYTLSDYFNSVQVDSAVFSVELTNSFPISISSGTRIVFRSSPETASRSNIVYEYVLAQDVPAGGTYSKFTDILINRTITSRIFLFLEDFKSPGGEDVIFGSQPSEVRFEIKFLSVFKAGINTGREYTICDTTGMELAGAVTNFSDSTADGTLKLFINSSMPVNFTYQIYFFDETKTELIDSLYHGDMVSPGCKADLSGVPYGSVEKKFEISISAERMRNLKRAKYMAYKFRGDTHGYTTPVVYIKGDCFLQMQLTGDIKLKVGALLPG